MTSDATDPMKIAFLGSRGIPARYSGFETFYEQLAVRLAARGHQVTVYNRSHFIRDIRGAYAGVRLVSLPSIPTKHLDTITHTLLSSLHALSQGYDIVYYAIVGNSPLVPIARCSGAKTLLNVDGEDWARGKWGRFARLYQRQCERIACHTAGTVVADAKIIQRRYADAYRCQAVFVPYGANVGRTEDVAALARWGLQPRRYVLAVGRMVPENAFDVLLQAWRQVRTDMKLVIVGDAPFAEACKRELRGLADDRTVFTGYAFGPDYAQLSSHAFLYVQPSAVDGTRPALLDQMGFGNCVVVRGTPANREVIEGGYGCAFDPARPREALAEVLTALMGDPVRVEGYRQRVMQRIEQYYNWDWIAAFYEVLFSRLLNRQPPQSYDDFLRERAAETVSP